MSRFGAVTGSINALLKDQSKPWTRYFDIAEKKTGCDRLYIFTGLATIFALYLVVGVGQQLVCNILGFVYPAFCSMKALESPGKEDDTKWLTYWVVFALFTIVEYFSDFIVSWLPFYWLLKCLFYVWLMVPTEYNGSLFLYRRVIRPKFIQYQPSVDFLLNTARDTAIRTAAEALTSHKSD